MKSASSSNIAAEHALAMAGAHPVLLELGPRGRPAAIWDNLASQSTYIGVGYEAEQMRAACSHFAGVHLVNGIVVPQTMLVPGTSVTFHTTRDPLYCCVLEPSSGCAEYLDGAARKTGQLSCSPTSVDSALQRCGVDRVDWFHVYVGGVDLRLFTSSSEHLQAHVLALDTGFDIVDLWPEPGSRLTAFDGILARGFWLSRLSSHGFVRMRAATLERLRQSGAAIDEGFLERWHRVSPGWLFARFLRTIAFLAETDADRHDYVKLWSFALTDQQFGFAADVACDYERRFGSDQVSSAMLEEVRRRFKLLPRKPPPLGFLRQMLPHPIRRRLRRLVFGDS
ncbi:MAG: hypothetical protein LAN64_17580 [Acidobacteriia bacterium]|nr:hypothetical protein [Terriglobia bacterium]